MLGPIGAHLMSVLRVLTPDEIDRYAGIKQQQKVVEASTVGLKASDSKMHVAKDALGDPKNPKEEEDKAKILPLKKDGPMDEEELKRRILAKKKELEEKKKAEAKAAGGAGEEEDEASDQEQASAQNMPKMSEAPNSDLESIGILSEEKVAQINKAKEEKKNRQKQSASVFLINQREKLKDSRQKMVEQLAISQYRSSAALELYPQNEEIPEELEEETEELEVRSDSRGILVNKKQF